MAAEHPTPFTLERYAADDLPAAERSSLSTHLDACERCTTALTALGRDEEAFKSEVAYAAFRVAHEARREARPRARRPWRLSWLTPAVAALAATSAAALVVVTSAPSPDAPTVRLKGNGVALSLLVKEDAGVRPASPGEALGAGTTVQLQYDAGENTHVALLGLDAAGAVNVYFPEKGERLARVPAGPRGAFDFGLDLDGKGERFFAVFARGPQLLLPIVEAVRRQAGQPLEAAAALELPIDLSQSSVWVRGR